MPSITLKMAAFPPMLIARVITVTIVKLGEPRRRRKTCLSPMPHETNELLESSDLLNLCGVRRLVAALLPNYEDVREESGDKSPHSTLLHTGNSQHHYAVLRHRDRVTLGNHVHGLVRPQIARLQLLSRQP